jgi:hypothetical protein
MCTQNVSKNSKNENAGILPTQVQTRTRICKKKREITFSKPQKQR